MVNFLEGSPEGFGADLSNFDWDSAIAGAGALDTLSRDNLPKGQQEKFDVLTKDLEREFGVLTKEVLELKAKLPVDDLTGLINYQREFTRAELVPRMTAEAVRHGFGAAFVHLDINKFKEFNSPPYSWDVGDVVLKCMASALKETTREEDLPMRLASGDELGILVIDGADPVLAAKVLVDRLGERFRKAGERAAEMGDLPKELVEKLLFSCGIVKVRTHEVVNNGSVYEVAEPFEETKSRAQLLTQKAKEFRTSGNHILVESADLVPTERLELSTASSGS